MKNESLSFVAWLMAMWLVATQIYSQANLVHGTVLDRHMQPIEAVSARLFTDQGRFLCASLTDSMGVFHFRGEHEMLNSVIILEHMSYFPDTLHIDESHPLEKFIILKEKQSDLKEIAVVGQQPVVKIERGVFVYNAPLILEKSVARNVYELLKEIPGIQEMDNQLQFLGSDNLKIVVDGQPNSLTMEQIIRQLKNTPASKVEKFEIQNVAPAKYNFRGAFINVISKQKINQDKTVTGEISSGYVQAHDATALENIYLAYQKKKLNLDWMSDLNVGKSWSHSGSLIRQTINEVVYESYEERYNKNSSCNISTQLSMSYNFNGQNKLSLSYYLQTEKDYTSIASDVNYSYNSENEYFLNSMNRIKDRQILHNLSAEYESNNWSVGGDFVFFRNPSEQHYRDTIETTESANEQVNNSIQKVYKYSIFGNRILKILKNWDINYGTTLAFNKSLTDIRYWTNDGGTLVEANDSHTTGDQREYNGNIYTEVNHPFSKSVNLQSSLKVDYFRSDYSNNSEKTTLWNEWNIFPAVTVNYSINTRNNLQFVFDIDRRYPSYWAVNPQTSILSAYSRTEGNPKLKPSLSYRGKVMYMLDRKYSLTLSTIRTSDYFTQIPHFSADEQMTIYRYENYNYVLRSSAICVIPFSFSAIIQLRLILQGYRTHERIEQFYGYLINNIYYSDIISLNSSFKISPKTLFQITSRYTSPMRQGTYRLGERWNLDLKLKYDFSNLSSLQINCSNLFLNSMPRPMEIKYDNQYQKQRNYENREVSISFVYKLGNYKSKDFKSVDNERIGK